MATLPTTDMIIRTERGLTISGTRITLYDIMGYLKNGWPTELIQHWLNISAEQLHAALDYINDHESSVEAEYTDVLANAEKNRAYWEEQTLARRQYVANLPPPEGQESLYAKLQQRKAELGME